MKKWNVLMLSALLALAPAAGFAQDLPQLFTTVYESVGEGLERSAEAAMAAAGQELTLDMALSDARVQAGKPVVLTVTAGNPRPWDTQVVFSLGLPAHLSAQQDAVWEATLPAAKLDPQTGVLTPSVTVFEQTLTLEKDAQSAQTELTCEMSMGTRFYRAQQAVELCVPRISARAETTGTDGGRIQPGESYAYRVTVDNSGTADKDAAVELTPGRGLTPSAHLPDGFELADGVIRGKLYAPAGGTVSADIPVCVEKDALQGDSDALRLISGALTVDGERVPLPRVQACAALIQARLLFEKESLQAGEETAMEIVVVNSGLAGADVEVSCVLPEGLALSKADEKATPDEAVVMQGDEGNLPPSGAAVTTQMEATAAAQQESTLVFDLHMDAARQTADGVVAHTQVLRIPVTAQVMQEDLSEQIVGTSLAWRVEDQPAQLGAAVATRVYRPAFMGIAGADWSGLCWAGALLLIMVVCLYAAAKRDQTEDYCLE